MKSGIYFELINLATYNKISQNYEVDHNIDNLITKNKVANDVNYLKNKLSEDKKSILLDFELPESKKIVYKFSIKGFVIDEYLDSYYLNFDGLNAKPGSLFYTSLDENKIWIDNESSYLNDEKNTFYSLIFSYGSLRNQNNSELRWESFSLQYFDIPTNSIRSITVNESPSDLFLIQNTSEFFIKIKINVQKLKNVKWIKIKKDLHSYNESNNFSEILIEKEILKNHSHSHFLKIKNDSVFQDSKVENHYLTMSPITINYRKLFENTFLKVIDKNTGKEIYNSFLPKNKALILDSVKDIGWYEIILYYFLEKKSLIKINSVNVHIYDDFSKYLEIETEGSSERYVAKDKKEFFDVFFTNHIFSVKKTPKFDQDIKKIKVSYWENHKTRHISKLKVIKTIEDFHNLKKKDGMYKVELFKKDDKKINFVIYLNTKINSVISFFEQENINYSNLSYLKLIFPWKLTPRGESENKLLRYKKMISFDQVPAFLFPVVQEKIYSLINLESITFAEIENTIAQNLKRRNPQITLYEFEANDINNEIKKSLYEIIEREIGINRNIDFAFQTNISEKKELEKNSLIKIVINSTNRGDLIGTKEITIKAAVLAQKIKKVRY